MKVVVITGGTSGLGASLKEKFLQENCKVFVLARSAEGENAIKCDVSNFEEVKNAFQQIKENCGKVDILINNAGVALAGVTELLPQSEIDKIIGVNLNGVINCTQCALPLMSAGGKIINISSLCGDFPLPFRTMYCVSKSAVSMFSYCTRLELQNAKIQVSAICPGNTYTNMSKNRVKLDATNEKYGDAIQQAIEKLNKEANNRMQLEYVSSKIFKIINKNKLKAQYVIGKKYKFLYFVQRLVPKSWLFWGINKFCK